MLHPFSIQDIRVLKLTYSLNRNQKDKVSQNKDRKNEFNGTINCNHQYEKKEKLLRVFLITSIGDENNDFQISVELGGAFKFKKTPDKKMLNQLGEINCPAILFPYLRELITDITRRGGFPPLFIPPINFVKLSKDKEKD